MKLNIFNDLPVPNQPELIFLLPLDDVSFLLPINAEWTKTDQLCLALADLEFVKKSLQFNATTIVHLRLLFNAVIELFPILHLRIGKDAEVVMCPTFKPAIQASKICIGYLIDDDRYSVFCFSKVTASETVEHAGLSLAVRPPRNQRV